MAEHLWPSDLYLVITQAIISFMQATCHPDVYASNLQLAVRPPLSGHLLQMVCGQFDRRFDHMIGDSGDVHGVPARWVLVELDMTGSIASTLTSIHKPAISCMVHDDVISSTQCCGQVKSLITLRLASKYC